MALAKHACGAPRWSGVRRFSLLCTFAVLSFPISAAELSAADAESSPSKAGKAGAKVNAPAAENREGDAHDAHLAKGFLIRVNLPITEGADLRVRRAVTQLLANLDPKGPRPVLVIELWPGQVEGGAGSDFFRASSLAKFLSRDLRDLANGIKTVAYIPKTIKGHAVLVAMACEEIVMAPDAEIGDAGIDENVISPFVRSGYKEVADSRSTIPLAIALAMLDRGLKVLKVTTEVGTEYVLEDGLEEVKKHRTVQNVEELKPRPLLVDGRRGRQELGFVSYLVDDRAGLAQALKVSPDSLQDNPALAGGWRPIQVNLRRPITSTTVNRVQKQIEDQVRTGDVNLIILQIDSDGGSYDHSLRLAGFLSQLDSSQVRTVAYIPQRARSDAALIAVACDQIVAGPDAKIGGEGAGILKPGDVPLAVRSLREALRGERARSWSVPAAMIDPELKVYRYTQKATGLVAYMCDEEAAQQADPNAWTKGELITGAGGPLQLSGRKAEEMGLVWKLIDSPEQLKDVYNLDHDLAPLSPGWADYLIDALTSEGARMILLILLFVGVYLELHSPGVGVGGFVALLAAILYFWSQHLQGNPVVLEILLFLAGVLCLGIEIFVIPGLAIFGLGGGLLIIASLVLASQTFVIPANDYQLGKLRDSMVLLGGAAVGSVAVAAAMRRFLPHAPVFNRMMLAPPSGDELEAIAVRELLIDLDHLLGRQGVATTRLVPSGKARFGDQLVDVIADGEAIDRGTAVEVTDVSGSRVVVRAVRNA
jgi:membrane-bound serine protease (ClpP class)